MTFIAKEEGFYKILFSNTHSWMRSKQLKFRCVVLKPVGTSTTAPKLSVDPQQAAAAQSKSDGPKLDTDSTQPTEAAIQPDNVRNQTQEEGGSSKPSETLITAQDQIVEQEAQVKEEEVQNVENQAASQPEPPSIAIPAPALTCLGSSPSDETTFFSTYLDTHSLTLHRSTSELSQTAENIDGLYDAVGSSLAATEQNLLLLLSKPDEDHNTKIIKLCQEKLNAVESTCGIKIIRLVDLLAIQSAQAADQAALGELQMTAQVVRLLRANGEEEVCSSIVSAGKLVQSPDSYVKEQGDILSMLELVKSDNEEGARGKINGQSLAKVLNKIQTIFGVTMNVNIVEIGSEGQDKQQTAADQSQSLKAQVESAITSQIKVDGMQYDNVQALLKSLEMDKQAIWKHLA